MHTSLFLLYFVNQQLQNSCFHSNERCTENGEATSRKKTPVSIGVQKQVPLENRSVQNSVMKTCNLPIMQSMKYIQYQLTSLSS